jgi:hypothetical protein
MTPQILEALLRHYPELLEFYHNTGKDEWEVGSGLVVNIHDIPRGINLLPPRQRQALVLTCFYNLREIDAARLMGFQKRSSPVGSYKKIALDKLIQMFWASDTNWRDIRWVYGPRYRRYQIEMRVGMAVYGVVSRSLVKGISEILQQEQDENPVGFLYPLAMTNGHRGRYGRST